ncbi:MAG: membrane protein insertion efficiency factor YidD [Nitrospirae bacterium]|nr:membrane protein insertion efficiency factor YidD [Nitrospirota bacterium]
MYLKIFIGPVRFYQRYISILKPPSCRFFPSCSQYFIDAMQKFGVMKGAYKGMFRLLKCHPFHPGGYDPVRPVRKDM